MSTWRTLVARWRGGRPDGEGWPTLVPPTVPPGGPPDAPPRWNDEPESDGDPDAPRR